MSNKLNTIKEAIEDIRKGKIIIVVDDENRENEGDFVTAAQLITSEKVNFMLQNGRGLLCTAIDKKRARDLSLDLMMQKNTSLHETPFTISVDLLGQGCTTGISADDRAKTIKALVDPKIKANQLARPGHIFPLLAQDRGVLDRNGHTEAVVDITRLAGLKPGGALIEILKPNGKMARLPDLFKIAKKFNLKIVSIKDLIEYRKLHDSITEVSKEAKLPTKFGEFKIQAFRDIEEKEHLILSKGNISKKTPLVRVHSECLTGDVFLSRKCDCGAQLHKSMKLISEYGSGMIIYLRQEGRGIGLLNKINAYYLQNKGRDTVEANLELGFKKDHRDYSVAAAILKNKKISKIKLITNNPHKIQELRTYGVKILERVEINTEVNIYNKKYLKTKNKKLDHKLKI